jgi:uncharacterized protein YjaZ
MPSSTWRKPSSVVAFFVLVLTGCAERGVAVRFFRSESYTFSSNEQRLVRRIAESATREVRALLPGVPPLIEITVRPGPHVIPETGTGGDAMPPTAIMVTIDASRSEGVEAITKKWLRQLLFHEIHHLVRWQLSGAPRSIVERAVFEGMATAFERDFAGDQVALWGVYPEDVAKWADEVSRLPPEASSQEWLFRNPDGRRWIGYKVGTFWVDEARKRSGRSAADLVTTPALDVIALSR